MRQGNDVGTQYRSAIYTYSASQKKPQRHHASGISRLSPITSMVLSPQRSSTHLSSTLQKDTISSIWQRILCVPVWLYQLSLFYTNCYRIQVAELTTFCLVIMLYVTIIIITMIKQIANTAYQIEWVYSIEYLEDLFHW